MEATDVSEPPELPEDIWDICYNASSTNASRISEAPVFWVEGIGLSVTSLIGILGNIVTVIVLNRISLNNVFNQVRFISRATIDDKGSLGPIKKSCTTRDVCKKKPLLRKKTAFPVKKV